MRGKVVVRRVAIVYLLLLIVQSITYFLWAPEAKVRMLLSKSTGGDVLHTDAYMVVDAEVINSLSERERAALQSILQELSTKLVNHFDELPPENVVLERDAVYEYRDASQNGWSTHLSVPFFFVARYGSHVGPEGAYSGSGAYIWVFGTWLQIWRGNEVWA